MTFGLDDCVIKAFSNVKKKFKKTKKSNIKYTLNKSKKKIGVVFCFHGSSSSSKEFIYLRKKLISDGFDVVIFDYPEDILTHSAEYIVDIFEDISVQVDNVIKYYKGKYTNNFTAYGTSLGSYIGLYAASRNENLGNLVLSVPGSSFEFMFSNTISNSLSEENKEFLDKLKKITPKYLLVKLRKKRMLFLTSINDRVIPYRMQQELVDGAKSIGIDFVEKKNHFFGHYITAFCNLLNYGRIKNFIDYSNK